MIKYNNPMTAGDEPPFPRPGLFATVRNRRGVIAAVEPYDGPEGRLHLVDIEYKDDQHPAADRSVNWSRTTRNSPDTRRESRRMAASSAGSSSRTASVPSSRWKRSIAPSEMSQSKPALS